eukprot:g17237.t1
MIKKARAHLGKSYADVAREIYGEITDGKGHTTGRNRNLISSWERGKTLPRQNILPKLAEAIEADLEVLTRARQQDEADRRGALMPEPDFTAGAVAGRPDLVVLSVKAVVPIADFARIVQDIAASAQSVEHEEDEEARATGCQTKADADLWLSAFLQGNIPGVTPESLAGKKSVVLAQVDVTFDQLFDGYLEEEQPNQKFNLAPWRPVIGKKVVNASGSDDIKKARDTLLKTPRRSGEGTILPSTVRRYMGALIAAINWGIEAQMLEKEQAVALLRGVKRPPSNQPMQDFLTHEERDKVWFYCLSLVSSRDRLWKTAGVLCLLTKVGVRRGAVRNKVGGLTWRRVKFYDKPLVNTNHKGEEVETWGLIFFNDPEQRISNKRRVTAPMSRETYELLQLIKTYNGPQILGNSEDTLVFSELTVPAMDKHIKAIRREVGISRLTFKILRTTWASLNMINQSDAPKSVKEADFFLSWLFGDALGHVFACAVDEQRNGWKQGRWSETRNQLIKAGSTAADTPDLAAYYSVGLFPDREGVRRRKDEVIGVVGLVLDDIGTKAGVEEGSGAILDKLNDMDAIGAKIDTSPGNQHWVIKYRTEGQQWPDGEAEVGVRGKRALDLHVLLVNAFAGLGAADRIGDVTRLVRLPAGKNLKPDPAKKDYVVRLAEPIKEGAAAFQADLAAVILTALGEKELAAQCEMQAMLFGAALDKWSDDLWKEVKQVLKVAGRTRDSELGSGSGQTNLCADLARPDPWLALQIELAERMDWVEPIEGSAIGTVDCRCPFAEEHSTDDRIRYLGDGNWKCHHSSCQEAGRTVPDFKRRLRELWEDVRDVEAGEPTADGLIARWSALGYDGVPQGVSGQRNGDPRFDTGADIDSLGNAETTAIEAEADEIAAAIGSEGDRTVAVGQLLQRYVLVLDGPKGSPGWFDLVEERLIPKAEIEQEEPVVELFEVGKTGDKAVWKILSNDVRCERFAGFISEPGKGRVITGKKGGRYLNKWRGSDVLAAGPAEDGEPEVFLEFMDWFAGEVGTVQRDTLDRYIAWILRNPAVKAPMTVCLVGGQGVGKDLLISLLTRLVGRANVKKVPLDDLVGQFNEWQAARIVYVPEVDGKGRYELLSRIKDLSGGDGHCTINKKYERPYQARDVSIYWMTTNEDGALPIDLDSRRDFVVGCPHTAHLDGFEFYSRLAEAIGEGGSELGLVMRHYVERVDLEDFSPFAPAPVTAAKIAMAEEGQSAAVTAIMEALQGRGMSPDGLEGVSEEAKAMVSSWVLTKYLKITCGLKSGGRGVAEAMRKMGWVKAPKKIRLARENQSVRAYIWTPKRASWDPEFMAVGDDVDDLVRQKIRVRVDAGDSCLLKTPIGVEKGG